jgi:hypothetical protein
MLSTMFSAAMKQKLIRTNPAVGLELPKVVKAKIEPSSIDGVRAILEQAPADVRLSIPAGRSHGTSPRGNPGAAMARCGLAKQ